SPRRHARLAHPCSPSTATSTSSIPPIYNASGWTRPASDNVSNHAQQVVSKLWNYCNVLRDDGLSYGDYVEQLTYLLFLKMAHERTTWGEADFIPGEYGWPSLLARDGDELEAHYRHTLERLGR